MNKISYSNVLRKTVATSLVACMAMSMAGCGGNKKNTTTTDITETPVDSTTPGSTDTSNLSYTYNDYQVGSPNKWNPHEWETADDRYILDYTTIGLYDFQLNETRDNYEIVPEMAAGEPVDVTSEYAGNETYGVPKDAEEGYAFKIALNEKACWEDGTPINADSYIYSMKQILDPKMSNYRASSYTSGTMTIANADAYMHSELPIYTDIFDGKGYRDVEDKDMWFSFKKDIAFFGGSAESYHNDSSKADFFKDADGNDLFEKYAEKDYYQLTDEAKQDILTISKAFGDNNDEAYKEWCYTYDGVSDKVDFSTVGLIKTGDYEITLVLAQPITNFFLHYNLSSNWLVNEELYEKNKKETGDIIKTSYGTAVDNYMSYGPYKLTEYQIDKQITLEKNDKWYGYTDGNHEGQFQTTKINTQIVEAQATRLQLFLQGKLDNVDLVADDMDTYRSSEYVVYTPQSYTSKITFNTDKKALKKRESEGVNKRLLAYKDFRKGLALAVDRTEFAAQCTATHKAGYGLLNYIYVSDPETGELYRNTEQAKAALCRVYGVDSEDQITGYDKEKASELLTKAYNEALEAGDIKDTDKVEFEYAVYNSDDTYAKMTKFLQDAFQAAAVGTPLEGRITIKMVADADYYDHAKQGQFDMITSTWGGSSMDPFGLMECYVEDGKVNEYGFKPKEEKLTIDLNGESITKTMYDWYDALCNKEYAVADSDTRVTILAAMEEYILDECRTTPIYYRTNADLYSRKVINGAEQYVQIMEFGDVRHMTYAYDDAAWEAYCKENNNQLTY